jgi:N-acetylglucosamine transport system permease protein
MQTLNVALLNFYDNMQYTSNWGGLFAGVTIVVLPMIVLYLFLGRRIVSGMTQGIGK